MRLQRLSGLLENDLLEIRKEGRPLDRLDAMSVLLTVVKAGSFSAAARELGVPVANVSRKIAELERHLNTGILIRSSRRMTLTDAGRSYVEACKRILDEVEEAERAASGEFSEPKGHLTVTAPVSFGRLHLLPVALEFLEQYPNIDIRLVLSDRTLDLLEDNVALAIRIGNLAGSSLIATRLGATRIVVCASPAYLDRAGRPQKPEDLRDHHCITFDNLAAPEAWRFVSAKGDVLVPVRSRLTVSTAEAAIDAAIAGVGLLRMMSYKIEDARRTGALEIVLEEFEPAPWAVSLLYPGQGPLPLKLRAFLNFAAPRLRARLA